MRTISFTPQMQHIEFVSVLMSSRRARFPTPLYRLLLTAVIVEVVVVEEEEEEEEGFEIVTVDIDC